MQNLRNNLTGTTEKTTNNEAKSFAPDLTNATNAHIPDKKEYFFKRLYSDQWGLGKERQDKVIEKLQKKFGDDISIKEVGYGADSVEFIAERNKAGAGDPDLAIYDNTRQGKGRFICYVEVTGGKTPMSEFGKVMLREDKIDHAKHVLIPKGLKTFYCHVYPNRIVVHDDNLASVFRSNVEFVTVKGYRMPFCMIPVTACDDMEKLFFFIASQLGKS